MRTRKSFLLILLLAFSFYGYVSPVSADFSVDVFINDAYYGDLDGDGAEDDIKADLTVYLYNNKIKTNVELYIGITLPSGQDFWFVTYLKVEKYTYSTSFGLRYDLLNTALEPGWYQADAVGFANGEKFSYMDTLIFDPPGATKGGDPLAIVEIY